MYKQEPEKQIETLFDCDGFQIFSEQVDDGILVIDNQGKILYNNEAASLLYGYLASEFCILTAADLYAPEKAETVAAQLNAGRKTPIVLQTVHRRRDGGLFPVEISFQRAKWNGSSVLISSVKDLSVSTSGRVLQRSERKYQMLHEDLLAAYEELTATEEELRQQFDELMSKEDKLYQQNRVLNLLHDVALDLIKDLNLEDSLRKIVGSINEIFNAPNSFIHFVDEAKEHFQLKIGTGIFTGLLVGGNLSEGIVGEAHQTGEVVEVRDYCRWEKRLPDRIFDAVHYFVVVPLKDAEKMFGAIGVAFTEPEKRLAEDELILLRRFADLAALSLRNAELVSALQAEVKERQRIAEGLRLSEEKFSQAFYLSPDTITISRMDGTYLEVNEGFVRMSGFSREEVIGKKAIDLGIWVDPAERDKMAAEQQRYGSISHMEVPFRRKDGQVRYGQLSASLIYVAGEPCHMVVVRDNTEIRLAEKEHRRQDAVIQRMAYYDPLTDLPNRRYLTEWLQEEVDKARQGKTAGFVLFVDLDDLKLVNDTYGHSCGDEIIIATGRRIIETLGNEAFVARVGGDEFVVVLPHGHDYSSAETAVVRLLEVLGKTYTVAETHFHMSASIGIAAYPADGDTMEEVVKNADNAMYAAKRSGKNCWRFYTKMMQTAAYEKMRLTSGLRYALPRGELFLVYQPQILLREGRTAGFEALLRWNSSEYGAIPPSLFIPLAEQAGMIHSIGRWVFEEACRFAKQLAEQGWEQIPVAVNISSRQLDDAEFLSFIEQTITQVGIKPQQLELEITESFLLTSIEDATKKLTRLKEFGVRMSLDDFGTGYSSLTYLHKLPVETLKIDKSFIDMITVDGQGEKMIASMIAMAHMMNLNVVAEGVETERQLAYLKAKDCDRIQGYIFSRPVSAEAAMQFLQNNNS
ncbi:MAG: EAL domain-containing protein [Sporomusaceae bacterium]|nr:EAL domain-containing protein [Sporomusaceae bacterium]